MRFRPKLEELADRCLPSGIDPYPPDDPFNPSNPLPDLTAVEDGDAFYLGLGLTDPWVDPIIPPPPKP